MIRLRRWLVNYIVLGWIKRPYGLYYFLMLGLVDFQTPNLIASFKASRATLRKFRPNVLRRLPSSFCQIALPSHGFAIQFVPGVALALQRDFRNVTKPGYLWTWPLNAPEVEACGLACFLLSGGAPYLSTKSGLK